MLTTRTSQIELDWSAAGAALDYVTADLGAWLIEQRRQAVEGKVGSFLPEPQREHDLLAVLIRLRGAHETAKARASQGDRPGPLRCELTPCQVESLRIWLARFIKDNADYGDLESVSSDSHLGTDHGEALLQTLAVLDNR